MLTRVYDSYLKQNSITVLKAETIYPLTKTELEDNNLINNLLIQEKLRKAYALHYFQGTWWSNKPISDLLSVVKKNYSFRANF